MTARDAARGLAFGRIALGAALVVAPRRAAGGWVGPDGASDGAAVLARALGVRDAVFGGMVLHTVDHPQVGPRWLTTAALVDAVDAVATLAVLGSLPAGRGRIGLAVAAGSALAHLALSRSSSVGAGGPAAPA